MEHVILLSTSLLLPLAMPKRLLVTHAGEDLNAMATDMSSSPKEEIVTKIKDTLTYYAAYFPSLVLVHLKQTLNQPVDNIVEAAKLIISANENGSKPLLKLGFLFELLDSSLSDFVTETDLEFFSLLHSVPSCVLNTAVRTRTDFDPIDDKYKYGTIIYAFILTSLQSPPRPPHVEVKFIPRPISTTDIKYICAYCVRRKSKKKASLAKKKLLKSSVESGLPST